MVPEDLRYGKDHEWVKDEGNGRVRVGITQFAQQELGDVVFVELPETETTVEKDDGFAVVESVKAVSDIYAPVAGTIVEANTDLEANPELINEDPFGKGWIAVISMSDKNQLDELMTAEDYRSQIGED